MYLVTFHYYVALCLRACALFCIGTQNSVIWDSTNLTKQTEFRDRNDSTCETFSVIQYLPTLCWNHGNQWRINRVQANEIISESRRRGCVTLAWLCSWSQVSVFYYPYCTFRIDDIPLGRQSLINSAHLAKSHRWHIFNTLISNFCLTHACFPWAPCVRCLLAESGSDF